MRSFHFSVDDVLPALIEVTDKNVLLVNNQFFNQLRCMYVKYAVKTGLNLFLYLELIIRSEDIKGLFINFENNKL
jgi:hypothetical protein